VGCSSHIRVAQVTGVETDGRNLHGVAVPFGVITRVNDGGPSYREGFNRSAFTKSMKERGARPIPLLERHAWQPGATSDPQPLGPTTFRVTPAALEFHARLSATRRADEVLALVNDGIYGDVSIGFRAFRTRPGKPDQDGPWLERMEAEAFELSIATVGTGAYPGAVVTAVRTAASVPSATPRLDELRRRRSLLILPD
jgi:Escherichia/Staphylococcus phage prohead protease